MPNDFKSTVSSAISDKNFFISSAISELRTCLVLDNVAADQEEAHEKDYVIAYCDEGPKLRIKGPAWPAQFRHLFCICILHIRVFSNHYAGYGVEYRKQYFHERILQNKIIRSNAGGWDGPISDYENDCGRSLYLCFNRRYQAPHSPDC